MTRRMTFVLIGLAVVSSLARAAEEKTDRSASKTDLERLQGTWTLVSMESEGDVVAPENFKDWNAVYKGDLLMLRVGEDVRRHGIVTLNAASTPKAINTWDQGGRFADQTVPGIYQLDGDDLKLCFAQPGEPRPTAFTTKDGKAFLLVVYKRKKP